MEISFAQCGEHVIISLFFSPSSFTKLTVGFSFTYADLYLLCNGTAVYTAQQLVLEEELEELIKHVSVARLLLHSILLQISQVKLYIVKNASASQTDKRGARFPAGLSARNPECQTGL